MNAEPHFKNKRTLLKHRKDTARRLRQEKIYDLCIAVLRQTDYCPLFGEHKGDDCKCGISGNVARQLAEMLLIDNHVVGCHG